MQLTAIFQKVPEGYIAFVEEIPGVNTQGETLNEAKANLVDAVNSVFEANRALTERFIGEQLRNTEVVRQMIAL